MAVLLPSRDCCSSAGCRAHGVAPTTQRQPNRSRDRGGAKDLGASSFGPARARLRNTAPAPTPRPSARPAARLLRAACGGVVWAAAVAATTAGARRRSPQDSHRPARVSVNRGRGAAPAPIRRRRGADPTRRPRVVIGLHGRQTASLLVSVGRGRERAGSRRTRQARSWCRGRRSSDAGDRQVIVASRGVRSAYSGCAGGGRRPARTWGGAHRGYRMVDGQGDLQFDGSRRADSVGTRSEITDYRPCSAWPGWAVTWAKAGVAARS